MAKLSPEDQKKQELYRDARVTGEYDNIWQTTGKCVFCDLKDKYIFFEENGVVMTVSLYAYIDGNFMIIPRRHVATVKDLTPSEWETIRKFIYIAKKIIRKVHGIKGVNYVLRDGGIVANSTVAGHLHIHAIPFDAPDLITWNFRQLKSTPIENAEKYRQARKKIIEAGLKYEEKYSTDNKLPVVCDALIMRGDELLFQERAEGYKYTPDTWTIPGGHIDDFSVPLEAELAREIQEEVGLKINPGELILFDSTVAEVKRVRRSEHLRVVYPQPSRFIRNTYLLRDLPATAKLKPGSDCKALHWVKLSEAHKCPLSPGLLKTVKLLQQREATRD